MTLVVVDTGVFVSALIGARGSAPDLVVRAMIDDRIEVVACPQLLDELSEVLRRPKFEKYIGEVAAAEFIARLQRHARVVADAVDPPPATRDPNDDYLVAIARREHAIAIVSGDRDLLDAQLQDLPVWTARQLADHASAKD